MANAFDFQLTADDQVSASILRIEEAIKNLNPMLDKTRKGLELGGQDSRDQLDELGNRFKVLAKNARTGVQFIGDLVPPLKMVGGLTFGLGGAAVAVNAIKRNLTDFANTGYRIDTIAKNVSMTADAFQELTGAMIVNGTTREAAESSISGLFDQANDAAHGRNDGFLALLQQKGIGISETKEGLADVAKLMNDINRVMQAMPSGEQALFIQKLGLSPEMLSYLRQTTSEVQRLKDQARRDGLIFSDKDLENALAFKGQLNQIGAAWDGLFMKSQSWLGQSETVAASVDQLSQTMLHGPDNFMMGSVFGFNKGGKQADLLRNAYRDEKFKETLSWKEKMDLYLGYASENLSKKLNSYYNPIWRAEQLKGDLDKIYVPSAEKNINSTPNAMPYDQRKVNSRGLRNNNAGNVRAAPNTIGSDGEFPVFANARDGNAALARQLMLYGDRGNNTLNGIIHTYAPSKENNTRAYIKAVSEMTGFNPNERINLHSPEALQKLIPAIIKHENGTQPFSRQEIGLAINDSVNDSRWSGLRDRNRLFSQRQSGDFGGNTHQGADNLTGSPSQSLFTPTDEGGKGISKITEAMSKAIDENTFKLEITLVNPQTGERRKVETDGRGRVSLSMQSLS